MATFCPYCDKEIEDMIHNKWAGDYPSNFELECPKCRNVIEIDVEQVPLFIAHVPIRG